MGNLYFYQGFLMGSLFLGADLSLTGSGLVIIDDSYNIVKMEVFKPKVVGVERLFHLRNMLESFLLEFKEDIKLVAIENYAYGKAQEGSKVFEIGEWGGIFRLYMFDNNYNFILPSPTQVKKYITGKGEAKTGKDLIILDIYKKYGVEIRQADMADAYVMARIAKDFYNDEKNLTTSQQEVIKKIHESIEEGTIGVLLR